MLTNIIPVFANHYINYKSMGMNKICDIQKRPTCLTKDYTCNTNMMDKFEDTFNRNTLKQGQFHDFLPTVKRDLFKQRIHLLQQYDGQIERHCIQENTETRAV